MTGEQPMPPRLILASTSPYRRALLERLRLPFDCLSPRVDERALQQSLPHLTPLELAEHLAQAKAASLAESAPDAVILGGDQLLAFRGQILGKPGTITGAIDQLVQLSGNQHQLITAISVRHPEGVIRHTDVATLFMRDLDAMEITRYVVFDSPTDCAGSYKLESLGITLFDRIDCADHSAITGLPLIALSTILRGLGYNVP